MKRPAAARPDFLPELPAAIWILFGGRLLASLGLGFVLFYASIFFTRELGLSYTQLGLGIAASGASGIVGRLVGGVLSDRPDWGRRRTLLVALATLSAGYALFAITHDFVLYASAYAIVGWGFGLYWPANEAAVADLTTGAQRAEAYGLTRAGDSLGLGLGVVVGQGLIALTGNYRLLFWLDALAFLGFWLVALRAIKETRPASDPRASLLGGYSVAFRDSNLLLYAAINLVFTSLTAQLESTVPVYLRDFGGLEQKVLGVGFIAHVALLGLIQFPVARLSSSWRRTRSLAVSAVFWAVALVLLYLVENPALAGFTGIAALLAAAVALAFMHPAASALVAALAPEDLRGAYLSINSQCWAVGYIVGPALGGRILDLGRPLSDWLWPGLAAIALLNCLPLVVLEKRLPRAVNQQK
ncbi:MFS transporter [Gloeobacter kilaueensis]|uniref:Major facilitator family transporter n=1 Tax=Gloeobacter kilaueensis (strain ATCC BAA-2537 / CCAP 1431/1 / ULC 316 / JS1) TaxID=1183438 RepID=U5QHH0_GLOK1|nr:MFS transporter [Gloeobacter kilaueensis]AGY57084.1 major facilitator family transporter [Gloeobacter kilaueensis JS1]